MPRKRKSVSIDDVKKLGYEVSEAFVNDNGTVYHVEGFGVILMASESDADVWLSLYNGHDGRASQIEE